MSNPCADEPLGRAPAPLAVARPARLPDLSNLPKPRWRDALRLLAGPAVRLHRYRNLRNAMLYHLLSAGTGHRSGAAAVSTDEEK